MARKICSDMQGIIKLLDTHVSNQLAAGEVVPHPAYIVKEFLENAIDAGASDISVYTIDGGKRSVRVVDNGKGMSREDALFCFHKHATSKIEQARDLYQIQTMGFRGEALAAIAAVCKVILKTKTAEDKTGILVSMENSQKQTESVVAMERGTDIEAKNLFYNLPARKKFLDNDAREAAKNRREFLHIALAYPEKTFRLIEDDKTIYHLPCTANIGNRIIQVYPQYRDKLLPLKIEMDCAHIEGFIGVPELAKRSADKYFFINKRYIVNLPLQYSIRLAYEHLLEKDKRNPFFCLYLSMDPSKFDVNIHPNKQEVKFGAQDEELLRAYLKAGVRRALDTYTMQPMDFSMGDSYAEIPALRAIPATMSEIQQNNPLFSSYTQKNSAHIMGSVSLASPKDWQNFYNSPIENVLDTTSYTKNIPADPLMILENFRHIDWGQQHFLQLYFEWILVPLESGLLFLHQQRIHQHILFHRYHKRFQKGLKTNESHRLLLPEKLQIQLTDLPLFEEMLPSLQRLGYSIVRRDDSEDYWVEACPSAQDEEALALDIDKLLAAYALDKEEFGNSKEENIMRAMALKKSVKIGKALNEQEMRNLASSFFAIPNLSDFSLTAPPFVFKSRIFLREQLGI